MRPQSYQQAVCILVFAFLAGCSSHLTNVTSNADVRPQQKHHYLIYYSDRAGIHVFNTTTNIDNLIFRYPPNTREHLRWEISPDNTKIAFTYAANDFEEITLSILDLMSRKSWQIKKIPKNFHYSFKW